MCRTSGAGRAVKQVDSPMERLFVFVVFAALFVSTAIASFLAVPIASRARAGRKRQRLSTPHAHMLN